MKWKCGSDHLRKHDLIIDPNNSDITEKFKSNFEISVNSLSKFFLYYLSLYIYYTYFK